MAAPTIETNGFPESERERTIGAWKQSSRPLASLPYGPNTG